MHSQEWLWLCFRTRKRVAYWAIAIAVFDRNVPNMYADSIYGNT